MTRTSWAERPGFTPLALGAIAAVAAVFSIFVDVAHANQVAQAITLAVAGIAGYPMGVSVERSWEKKGDMTGGGAAFAILFWGNALLWALFLAINFQFNSQYVHTSFWLVVTAAIVYLSGCLYFGSHAAFRYPVKAKPEPASVDTQTTNDTGEVLIIVIDL